MTDDEARNFGEGIRRLRREKGLGVRELARNSGLSSSLITRLEQGEVARPHVDTLKALASALDAPLAELFAWAGYAQACGGSCIGAHLRVCYGHLPEEKIREIEEFAGEAEREVQAARG